MIALNMDESGPVPVSTGLLDYSQRTRSPLSLCFQWLIDLGLGGVDKVRLLWMTTRVDYTAHKGKLIMWTRAT